MSRIAIPEFQTANNLYARASVTFWEVDDNGVKTATKATLFDAFTGTGTLENPVTLDSEGRFKTQPYIETAVIAAISGLSITDHDTGVITAAAAWRGDWVTATVYYPLDFIRDGANGDNTGDLYAVISQHTSGTWATDKADSTKLQLVLDISTLADVIVSPSNPADDDKFLIATAGAWVKSASKLQAFMKTFLADTTAAAALATLGAAPADADPITTRGDIIRGDASGDPERLAIGAAGTAPVSDGTDVAYAGIIKQGLHQQWIPASAMIPRTSNGAAPGTVELSTNKVMIQSLDFNTAADEFAQFVWTPPKKWNAGTVTAIFHWSHAATSTNFGVRFFLQAGAFTNDDALDAAFGTAVGHAADTGGTTDDLYITDVTLAITIANAAKNKNVRFQVYRDVSDAGDTIAIDARLEGIELFYTVDAADDT